MDRDGLRPNVSHHMTAIFEKACLVTPCLVANVVEKNNTVTGANVDQPVILDQVIKDTGN